MERVVFADSPLAQCLADNDDHLQNDALWHDLADEDAASMSRRASNEISASTESESASSAPTETTDADDAAKLPYEAHFDSDEESSAMRLEVPVLHNLERAPKRFRSLTAHAKPQSETLSFAPSGLPRARLFRRLRPEDMRQDVRAERSAASQHEAAIDFGAQALHNLSSSLYVLTTELKRMMKAATLIESRARSEFLERLRFTVVTSGLLNDGGNSNNAGTTSRPTRNDALPQTNFLAVLTGELLQVKNRLRCLSSKSAAAMLACVGLAFAILCLASSILIWTLSMFIVLPTIIIVLRRLQGKFRQLSTFTVLEAYISCAQDYSAATAAAVTLVQEVELVARGYRLGSPLPPVSRLDDNAIFSDSPSTSLVSTTSRQKPLVGQVRRCSRIRHALSATIDNILISQALAWRALRHVVVEAELEQYHDIYELTRSDVLDTEALIERHDQQQIHAPIDDAADGESLRNIKVQLHQLGLVRKLYLCSLLALDPTLLGPTSSWSSIAAPMEQLARQMVSASSRLEGLLQDRDLDHVVTPSTAASTAGPVSPDHAHLHRQTRRFVALSQGLRALHARMQLLRDDSDRALESPTADVGTLGPKLLEQYEAVGADLKALVAEWDDGRIALKAAIGRGLRRHLDPDKADSGDSRPGIKPGEMASVSGPSTPTSLGGRTAIDESPLCPTTSKSADSGDGVAQASLSTTRDPSGIMTLKNSADNEQTVFEAVVAPRSAGDRAKGSLMHLSREERLAKMQDERETRDAARQQAEHSRHMLQELQSVIARGRDPSSPAAQPQTA